MFGGRVQICQHVTYCILNAVIHEKNNKILLSFLNFKLNFFFNSTHKTTAFNIIFKGKGLIKHENSYFQHLIIPLNSKYLHKK